MRPIATFFSVLVLTAAAQAQLPRSVRLTDPKPELHAPHAAMGPAAIDATLGERLLYAIDSVYNLTSDFGRYGVSASIIAPGMPQWEAAVGISYPGQEMLPTHLVEAASNTKTFVAAAILRLEEEGKLTINDRIGKWLQPFKHIDTNITIKQLLDHSSGVYDYLNDDETGMLFYDSYFTTPNKRYTPIEVLSKHIKAPNFERGEGHRYSNTGFTILGLIIEAASGKTVAEYFRENFFEPLGLDNTFAGSDEEIKGEFAHNWFVDVGDWQNYDLSTHERTGHLSLAWTAGYLVSTPSDLAKWSHELYRGKILSKPSMTKMLKMNVWEEGAVYGLGTAQIPYGNKRFYGHTGRLWGFNSFMFTNPRDSVTFSIVMNSDPAEGDVQLNDYALAILGEIYAPKASVASRSEYSVKVYPNPATKFVVFDDLKEAGSDIRLFDVLGREVPISSEQLDHNTLRVDARSLEEGVYSYILVGKDTQFTGKIMVAR